MPDLPAGFLDISRALPHNHPNWPGDPPLTITPGARMAQGDSVNTGVINTSTHTATHVDAPWHYADDAPTLDQVPLERYLGACLVVHVPPGEFVRAEVLSGLPDPLPPRLLLYTGQPARWATFPEDFMAVDPAFVHEAARRGVRLIGTDSPSVDPLTSKTLDAHHAFLDTGLLIVEGLNLSGVEPGEYTLICLPLPLSGVDGAPARAVLLPAGLMP
ncbi:kynurenine formamidase [Deinococcus irradiatisoli]|uniref:Kynurenine formamidase n=1 Tax=Deinococcus irradiatisoli TaxID=2202254 RepID=A0A2Z3JIL2_9DEIO|nr:cyclase family protein [Deinococcus irradiatisoli]AWN23441.1 kynurenine formamidase [Deinococcus irradiatisoli]